MRSQAQGRRLLLGMRHGRKLLVLLSAAILLMTGLSVVTSQKPTAAAPAAPVSWSPVSNGPGGAWHRLLFMSKGNWLKVLTTFPAPGRTELAIYQSTDRARTWKLRSTVNDGQRLVDNGFLYRAPNGDLLLSGRNNVLGSSYKISQWRSRNAGRSWVREADITSVDGGRGVWEPFYYTAAGGQTVVTWADETYKGFDQVTARKVSNDNGRTWSKAEVMVSDGAVGRPGMAVVVRMANKKYLAAFEVCGTRACEVFTKTSDDGIDWPDGIGNRVPDQVCGPFVTSFSDGRLFMTSCRKTETDHTTPVSVSKDFGATWTLIPSAFTDAGKFGGWPALYQTARNEIVAVSDGRMRFGTVSGVTKNAPTTKRAANNRTAAPSVNSRLR